eukprot:COSAG02_NODE_10814_length_1852_cov_5.936110_2_plen_147_part_01
MCQLMAYDITVNVLWLNDTPNYDRPPTVKIIDNTDIGYGLKGVAELPHRSFRPTMTGWWCDQNFRSTSAPPLRHPLTHFTYLVVELCRLVSSSSSDDDDGNAGLPRGISRPLEPRCDTAWLNQAVSQRGQGKGGGGGSAPGKGEGRR